MMIKNINPFTFIFSKLLQEERYSDKWLKKDWMEDIRTELAYFYI